MSQSKHKLLNDNELKKFVAEQKKQGKKIVLTSGSWDILHVGHMRYIKEARNHGDTLIVGVDSDAKIKKRKGEGRPIVPEDERVEMIGHLSYADAIYLKSPRHKPNKLIAIVEPDILIVSETTGHSSEKYKKIKKYCKEIITLKPQAKTSSTARIRHLHIDGKKDLANKIIDEIPKMIDKLM